MNSDPGRNRITRHLRISGRVQGVGYRDALRGAALEHGVDGWVRNRRDGTVEAVLQGEVAAVLAVVDWARRGPPASRVDRVDAAPEADGRRHEGFKLLPTE